MKLVIAGNYDEFLKEFEGGSNYKYLSELPISLFGYQNTDLVLCGTYYRRKDFDGALVAAYCAIHNIKLI